MKYFRYEKSIAYWQRVPATNDGVLGGFINVASSVSQHRLLQMHLCVSRVRGV